MNVRLLKAKRVQHNLRQKDLAKALGITEKAMCHKECSSENKFKAHEMLTLAKTLNLSLSEFDAIFFDHDLTNALRRASPTKPTCNREGEKKNGT
jgi:DNA-binding XRE family transcriptional regulator